MREAFTCEALASVLFARRQFEGAAGHFRKSLQIREVQPSSREYGAEAILLQRIAASLRALGDVKKALGVAEQSVARIRQDSQAHPILLAKCRMELGQALNDLLQLDRAETELSAALAVFEKWRPNSNADLATCLHGLGKLYHTQGKWEAARGAFARSQSLSTSALGEASIEARSASYGLAMVDVSAGKLGASYVRLRSLCSLGSKSDVRDDVDAATRLLLVSILLEAGVVSDVEDLLGRCLPYRRGQVKLAHGRRLALEGKWDAAQEAYREAHKAQGLSMQYRGHLRLLQAELSLLRGQIVAARESAVVLASYEPDSGLERTELGIKARILLSACSRLENQPEKAARFAKEAISEGRLSKNTRVYTRAQAHLSLADALRMAKRWGEAVEEYCQVKELVTGTGLKMPRLLGPCLAGMAEAEGGRRRHSVAAKLYLEALDAYKGSAPMLQVDARKIKRRFASFLEQTGDACGAKKLRDELAAGEE